MKKCSDSFKLCECAPLTCLPALCDQIYDQSHANQKKKDGASVTEVLENATIVLVSSDDVGSNYFELQKLSQDIPVRYSATLYSFSGEENVETVLPLKS